MHPYSAKHVPIAVPAYMRCAHAAVREAAELACSCSWTTHLYQPHTHGVVSCRNAEVEAHIAALRAELLHKEQENERVQLQLAKEKEERERAERQVGSCHQDCDC